MTTNFSSLLQVNPEFTEFGKLTMLKDGHRFKKGNTTQIIAQLFFIIVRV